MIPFLTHPDSTTLLTNDISGVMTVQQQCRDQLHELRLAQKTLATREEVVEGINAQREFGAIVPGPYRGRKADMNSITRSARILRHAQ